MNLKINEYNKAVVKASYIKATEIEDVGVDEFEQCFQDGADYAATNHPHMKLYPDLMALVEEVLKVWNEDGDCGEIQKITPIAWHRVLRKAEKVLDKSD